MFPNSATPALSLVPRPQSLSPLPEDPGRVPFFRPSRCLFSEWVLRSCPPCPREGPVQPPLKGRSRPPPKGRSRPHPLREGPVHTPQGKVPSTAPRKGPVHPSPRKGPVHPLGKVPSTPPKEMVPSTPPGKVPSTPPKEGPVQPPKESPVQHHPPGEGSDPYRTSTVPSPFPDHYRSDAKFCFLISFPKKGGNVSL